MKRREGRRWQWHQRRSFHLGEMLAYMAAGGAMDPRVGDGQFPVKQKGVLRLQTGEVSRLEGIALDVVNALFDLPLVPRRARSCGPEENAVVLAEGADLRVELRIDQSAFVTAALRLSRTNRLGAPPK